MSAANAKYNANSASVRRLLRECKEMAQDTSSLYTAAPLEDDLFEWHFTIRGPKDTEFEGGVYHGRILFPSDYPYRPPDIVFLTRNGRFELDKKICLTISSHHEETWRPSWSIRTVLVAIIAFMPSNGDGAIASLDWTPEERRKLAKTSLTYKCDKCGVHNSTVLREEDANETLNPSDVPEELQIRDSAKKPASASTSASPSSSLASSSSIEASTSSPSPSLATDAQPSATTTETILNGSSPSHSRHSAAPSDTQTMPASEARPVAHEGPGYYQNPAEAGAFQEEMPQMDAPNFPTTFQTTSQTNQVHHSERETLDVLLSLVVLAIGLLLINKLFIYL